MHERLRERERCVVCPKLIAKTNAVSVLAPGLVYLAADSRDASTEQDERIQFVQS
jgi:hypothetical protein